MSVKYGSGKGKFVGQSIVYSIPIPLDATQHFGAVIVADDGQLYYSNGFDWIIPTEDVEISRPSARVPTNATEQSQLRLSEFRSPAGLTQTGILFEISVNGVDFIGAETRTVTSTFATSYQLLYPEDGFDPGDQILWRGKYLGSDGAQSDFSIPYMQVFPDLITTPVPLTRENAVTGTFTLSAFESAPVFGLGYYQTEVEFYAAGATPGVSAPITTVTQDTGNVTSAPIPPLTVGASYIVRGRYSARANISSPAVFSEWSETRTIFLGAASIILEYDLTLMIARTAYVPINTLNNPLKPLNVTIDWGDGTTNTYTTAGIKTKIYAAGFTPTDNKVIVTISGAMDWYGTNTAINQSGLTRVENIGFQMGLESLRGAFRGTQSHLTYVTESIPETITSLQEAFHSSSCAANISNMNTINVQNLAGLFTTSVGSGPNCANWDVRNVTNVTQVFFNSQMNSPFTLGNWESLITTSEMFYTTGNSRNSFNQPIDYWNMSNVTDMSYMFFAAGVLTNGLGGSDFNQPIGSWDVSNVTTFKHFMGGSLVSNLSNWHLFNQPLDNWNVSAATDMSFMFSRALIFNQPVGSWDVSNVIDMSYMFGHQGNYTSRPVHAFDQPINSWNVSACVSMQGMFKTANFDRPLDQWDVSNVTNMSAMFEACVFNQPIGMWDVSKVTDMSLMFACVRNNDSRALFNQDIGSWNVSNVTTMSYMFGVYGGGAKQYSRFNNGGSPSISGWNTSKVTNMTAMFLSGLTDTDIPAHDFNQPIGSWDVSNVTTMEAMFSGLRQAFNQDISGWNLRAAGVNLTNFMRGTTGRALSQENYSRLLTGWGNRIADVSSGPFAVSTIFDSLVYNTTAYQPASRFTNAAAARAFLVAARSTTVSGSSDTDGNGVYTLNVTTGAYVNPNGWYFLKSGSTWTLFNASNVSQATGDGVYPWDVVTWTGVLSAATVLNSGAAWTITGDSAA